MDNIMDKIEICISIISIDSNIKANLGDLFREDGSYQTKDAREVSHKK